MRICSRWVPALVLLVGGFGCVSQNEVDRLRTLYRVAEEQKIDLQAQIEERDARIAAMRAASPDMALRSDLDAAIAERDQLRKAMKDLEEQLQNVVLPLPAEVSDKLEKLAAANPGLMTYDKARGMVQLQSDLTFASGRDDLRPAAASTLQSLAGVLATGAALPYDVKIVGHTDSVPIKHSKHRHPTNWHLSVHRAIAVMSVLDKTGVSPTRMIVAGRSKYDPIVPEGAGTRGAEPNRRVEIFLLATARSEVAAVAEPEMSTAPPVIAVEPPTSEAPEYVPPDRFK